MGSSGDPHSHQGIEGLSDPRLRVFTLLPDTSVLAFGVNGVSRSDSGGLTWRATSAALPGRNVTDEEDIAAPGLRHRTLRPVSIIPGVHLIVFESGGERMTRFVTNFR